MEVIITLATESTMGTATTSDKKTLPCLIQEAVDTFNELHDESFTFEGMQFKRTDEEEADIQARKDSGDLIPLDEWFLSLKTAEYQMTVEEAEAHLPDVEWPEERFDKGTCREQVVDYMRRMPDEVVISILKDNIIRWDRDGELFGDLEIGDTPGDSNESVAAPVGEDDV